MKRCYKVLNDGTIQSYIVLSESKDTVNVRTGRNPLITKFSKCNVFFTFEEAKLESLIFLNSHLQYLKDEIKKYETSVKNLTQLNEDDLERYDLHYGFVVFSVDD